MHFEIVGRVETPMLIHKKMHYTNVVLHESFAISCVVFNYITHCTNEEVDVGNYMIPKRKIVFPILMNVLLDENYFLDPHEFHPNLFLDSNDELITDEHLIVVS